MKFHIQNITGKVKSAACVSWRDDSGARRRRYFATRELAKAWIYEQQVEERDTGPIWQAIPATDRISLLEVWNESQRAGVSPGEVLATWKRHHRPSGVTLQEAIRTVIDAKSAANRRPGYVDSLEFYLRQFAKGREEQHIDRIGSRDIAEWIASGAPESRATRLSRLVTLFRYATRRGWIQADPTIAIDRPTIDRQAPRIFRPAECAMLMAEVAGRHGALIPHVTLELFAGIRPEEALRLTWQDIDLKRRIVKIDAAASKVRQRRLVDLSQNAVEWLKLGGGMPTTPAIWRRARGQICANVGLLWSHDVLRHTAASMMLARDQDAGRVALQLGNSPQILMTRYREVVTKEEAKNFWKIGP